MNLTLGDILVSLERLISLGYIKEELKNGERVYVVTESGQEEQIKLILKDMLKGNIFVHNYKVSDI